MTNHFFYLLLALRSRGLFFQNSPNKGFIRGTTDTGNIYFHRGALSCVASIKKEIVMDNFRPRFGDGFPRVFFSSTKTTKKKHETSELRQNHTA